MSPRTGLCPSGVPLPTDLRRIAEAIPHIVWIADAAGSIEYVSRSGWEYTGFPQSPADGWGWLSVVHPDDAERALRGWADARQAESLFELECRIRAAEGNFGWYSLRSSPLRDDSGRVVGWFGTATDIDKQKRQRGRFHRFEAELSEERRDANELGSVVMANMDEGLYTSDSEGRFTFLNAAAERMLGWSAQDLNGKSVRNTLHVPHPDRSPLLDECQLKVPTEGRAGRVTDAFTRKDGSMFPVSCAVTPLAGGEEARGLAVVFRDTTEQAAGRARLEVELEALAWVGRTREALDEGRLILYSQPIVPLAGGKPSEELLLRMIGRQGEILRPAIFLPAAEKYGLIGEIDRRVVTEAAQLAATGKRVQANLSALSISSPDLLPLIDRSLGESGADPGDLVWEITETALMEDVEAGVAFVTELAEIGCDLALDDFGTGYGSLTRLKRLPIDYLKIDIEFVRDLVYSSDSRHVVEAIVGLADSFGQQTIAEGVEDADTLELLGDLGVNFAQGYHLGRPAPLTEIAAPVPA